MRARRAARLFGLAAIGCGAMVVAGCGSDDSDGGGGGTAGASGFKGAPVKLMVIAPMDTEASTNPEIPAGAEAAAAAINKQGGIENRKVEIEFCNPAKGAVQDPNAGAACARKAKAGGHVALVGHFSTAQVPTVLPTVEKDHIADVGLIATGPESDATSTAAYPFNDGVFGSVMALPAAAEQMGIKKLAYMVTDVPGGHYLGDLMNQAIKALGLDVTITSIPVPISGVTTFDTFAQQIKKVGAEGIVLYLSGPSTAGLLRATTELGLDLKVFTNGFSFTEDQAQTIGDPAEGIIQAVPYPPAAGSDNKGLQQWLAEMKANGADDPKLTQPRGLNAWLSVYAIAEAAKQVDGELTSESLWAALPKMKPMDVGQGLVTWDPAGATTRLTSKADLPRLPGNEWPFTRIKGGKAELASDLKPVAPVSAIRGGQ